MQRGVLVAAILLCMASAAFARDLTTVQVNVNQVGYFPPDAKVALVETNLKLGLTGAVARVLNYPSLTATSLADMPLQVDRHGYGKYQHNYAVDFSALNTPGGYVIQIRDASDNLIAQSPPTSISSSPFDALIPLTLRFFGVQRCGNTSPLIHATCHTDDGIAVGGPHDGSAIDVSGGWHDAGDYVKFASTISYVTFMQLFALQKLAPADLDSSVRTMVRDEARIGVDWLLKAHPDSSSFYFQVADSRDHDVDWRLPENDTVYPGGRPAYYGLGANLAGRTSAALALCAHEWQADDPTLAASCAAAAAEIYALGKSIVAGASTDPKQKLLVTCIDQPQEYPANRLNCDFYSEDSWADDMTLGAVELYALTNNASYLTDALAYAADAGPAYEAMGPIAVNDLALFELYPFAPTTGSGMTQALVLSTLDTDAGIIRNQAARDRYNVAERRYLWGSSSDLATDAITCLLHARLAADPVCEQTAREQLDFLLGRNPFGTSFLAGAGTLFPQNPHHGVAVLLPSEWYAAGNVIGSLAGGPAGHGQYPFRSDSSLKLAVRGDTTSPFAKFQNSRFQYHDIHDDYVSNEPALDYNADVLALLLAYAS